MLLKDDNDWVKHCISWEVERIRQTGRPKKTWWDCVKNDMESLGLSRKDAQSRNKRRKRLRGNQLTQVHLEKRPLKRSVCVCVLAITCVLLLLLIKWASEIQTVVSSTIAWMITSIMSTTCIKRRDSKWARNYQELAKSTAASVERQLTVSFGPVPPCM